MNNIKASRIIRETRDIYNSIAEEWDTSRERPSGVKMKSLSLIKQGNRVLDLGCGNGFMAPYILERGALYEGLDISKNLIKIAKKKHQAEIKRKLVNFKVGTATKLPYADESFEAVISFAVLHHIPSTTLRQKFFKEVARVLKSDGRGTVIVWNLLNDWTNKRFKTQEQLGKQDQGDVRVPWKATKGKVFSRYLYQFKKSEIMLLAKKAGLKNVRAEYFNRAGEKTVNGEELVVTFKK
ncbi:MAG TPA: class I SAM-dependent methyltransferase [Patescibacteria group bacterium]|nr:class I SAM-dependent methyltransferase [Patescibacteria group bacterium]